MDLVAYSTKKLECKLGDKESGRYYFEEAWDVFTTWFTSVYKYVINVITKVWLCSFLSYVFHTYLLRDL